MAPPSSSGAAFAYDPGQSGLVLFGGCGGSGCTPTNATWVYHAQGWRNLGSSIVGPRPAADPDPVATFDRGDGLFLVVAGAPGQPGTSWSFSCSGGCRWTPLVAAGSAPPTLPGAGAALATESSGLPPLLVGGWSPTGLPGPIDPQDEVLEPPLEIAASLEPPVAPAESLVVGTINVTGGGAPYAFAWHFGGIDLANTSNVSLYFGEIGVHVLNVSVWDGFFVAAATQVTERSTGPSLYATAAPGTVDVGVPVHFVAETPVGGTPPYNVTWSWPDGTESYGLTASRSFPTPGTRTVGIVVTDQLHLTNSSTIQIHVVPFPSATIGSPRLTADAGGTLGLTAGITGGVAPVSYGWSFSGGAANASGANVTPRFSSPGTFRVTLRATDAVGATASASANVTIDPALQVLLVGVTHPSGWNQSIIEVANGSEVAARAVPSNGTPGYSISWSVTSPSGVVRNSSGPDLNFTAAEPGTYLGSVTVVDATGTELNRTFQVASVSPTSCPCAIAVPIQFWEVVVLVAIVLAAVGGVVAPTRARVHDRAP